MERRIGFLFPGQGAQDVGMGRDLFGDDAVADALITLASARAKRDLKRLCLRGPARALAETAALQPALAVVSLALWHRLNRAGVRPAAVAGHSLGELPAWVACGSVDAESAVSLSAERGRLMAAAAQKYDGGMIAVTGPSTDEVVDTLALFRQRGVVGPAAVNAPDQMTVSGDRPLLREIAAHLRHRSAARIAVLRVSGAWHSAQMAEAVRPYGQAIDKLTVKPPRVPMFFNRAGGEANSTDDARALIAGQLTHPVRWDLVMKSFVARKITDYVEIGPGKVLRGLVRLNTDDTTIRVHNVSDLRSLDRTLENLQQ